ncbi:hypothetical protein LCGC14_2396300 [marine sediment metagenome]|uniref:SDR family NAD(P)-dependent oxidoreductase n=1 Tax=marine sediment metagenome TaxID=412755 RepID=A0A0F9ER52_9ZZZZ
MNLGIDGKVALVTGASKGLGLGVASALASEGAKLAISSRSRERIDKAAEQIGALVSASYVSVEDVRAAILAARKILERVENKEERAILSMPLESLAMLQMSFQATPNQ